MLFDRFLPSGSTKLSKGPLSVISPLGTPAKSSQTKKIQRKSRLQDFRIIPVFLAEHGLASVSVSPDGNCLCRLAVGLYGSEERHLDVHNGIVTFVRRT